MNLFARGQANTRLHGKSKTGSRLTMGRISFKQVRMALQAGRVEPPVNLAAGVHPCPQILADESPLPYV
jgi:hypothetical protein